MSNCIRIDVLDHGYVRHVESWGGGDRGQDDEAGIIEAARQSTQGCFRGWERDRKLLSYLYGNKHSTPFEFAGMTIETRAPIFVFREWHRHRTQSYNEMSARYAPLPDLNYVPSVDRLMARDSENKQAGSVAGAGLLDESKATAYIHDLRECYERFQELYVHALDIGVPKELARLGMPVARYSQMRASANLRNWLGFLTLRMSPNAQWEIRQYADAVGELVAENFPNVWELFEVPS